MNVAEEMCASWLRHVKKCAVVQLNFRVSKLWHEIDGGEPLEMCNALRKRLEKHYGFKLFGIKKRIKDRDLKQIFNSAELDVVGFDFGMEELLICEVADHRRGCDYGGKDLTIRKVAEKVVRAVAVARTYTSVEHITVYVVATMISKPMHKSIQVLIDRINDYYETCADDKCQVQIIPILGHEVVPLLLNDLLTVAEDANIDDLFVRSLGLVNTYYFMLDCSRFYNKQNVSNRRITKVVRETKQRLGDTLRKCEEDFNKHKQAR